MDVRVLIGLTSASLLAAEDVDGYLMRAATTYKGLKSFQVETFVERTSNTRRSELKSTFALYISPPGKLRIDTKDEDGTLQLLFISNNGHGTEYRAWKNEYSRLAITAMSVSFSPERGLGLGEIFYDTIADGVARASIRGRETIRLGQELLPCVVVDVEYQKIGPTTPKYTFWIEEKKALILRRAVKFWDRGEAKKLVSSVRALTVNEDIPDETFDFTPPKGASEVPIRLQAVNPINQ